MQSNEQLKVISIHLVLFFKHFWMEEKSKIPGGGGYVDSFESVGPSHTYRTLDFSN